MQGIYVILDLHAAPGGQGYDSGISDYDPSKPSLWESAFNKSKTVALWKKLAEHFASDTTIAGYDLINEPIGIYRRVHLELFMKILQIVYAALIPIT